MSHSTTSSLGFMVGDLNDDFFTHVAQPLDLNTFSWNEMKGNNFPLTSELNDDGKPLNGVFKFILSGTDRQGAEKCYELAVRSRPNGEQNNAGWLAMFEHHGNEIQDMAKQFFGISTNLTRSTELELLAAQYAMKDRHLAQFLPNIYHTLFDKEREQYVVVSDYIDTDNMLIGGIQKLTFDLWVDPLCFKILKEFAKFHSANLDNTDSIASHFGDALVKNPRQHLACREWFRKQVEINARALPHLYTARRLDIINKYFDNMEAFTEELEAYPMTFVHNDAHTGNLWLRSKPIDGKSDLVLCDWESCCINVPQRDLISLLMCIKPPQPTLAEHLKVYKTYTAYYQQQLVEFLRGRDEELINKIKDKELFDRMVYLQMFEILLNRMVIMGFIPEEKLKGIDQSGIKNVLLYIEAQAEEYDTAKI